jgi:hypothetical protein
VPWDTCAYTPVLSFVLTLSLYSGVPDLQCTDREQARFGSRCMSNDQPKQHQPEAMSLEPKRWMLESRMEHRLAL